MSTGIASNRSLTGEIGEKCLVERCDISLLSSTSGNLIPALLILTGVFGWVIYTVGGSHFNWSPLRYTTLTLHPRCRERAGHRGAGHDCRLPESPPRRHR